MTRDEAPPGYHFDRGGFVVKDEPFLSRFTMDAAHAYRWWYYTPILLAMASALISLFAVLNSIYLWVP